MASQNTGKIICLISITYAFNLIQPQTAYSYLLSPRKVHKTYLLNIDLYVFSTYKKWINTHKMAY